jgi:hypothetical protein
VNPLSTKEGGVSTPELEDVQVLDRERDAGHSRENTGTGPPSKEYERDHTPQHTPTHGMSDPPLPQ